MLSESFLALYNEELRYLREDGQRFARLHPQVAQQLGMQANGVMDPFVERLLEGSAFLSARIQERLNNEQPEFALQMLARLAPYWYTPQPSVATIAPEPDLTSPQWHSRVVWPKGSQIWLHDASLKGKPVSFTTGRQLILQPLIMVAAECACALPASIPRQVADALPSGEAHLILRFSSKGVASLAELTFSPLTLTLTGDDVKAHQLLTSLLNDTTQILLWGRNGGQVFMHALPVEQLQQGGLTPDERLLPRTAGELPGYSLLREYFSAPSRFFCLELQGINDFLQRGDKCDEFEILFLLRRRPLPLIGQVSENDFRLFATPVINLSKRRCSPVLITGERSEYPVIVDPLHPRRYQIHHLLSVNGLLADGHHVPFSPLHGDVCFDEAYQPVGYSLRRGRQTGTEDPSASTSLPEESLFIAFSPGESGLDFEQVKALSIEAMVCDRYLVPSRLQQPYFQPDVTLPVRQIEMLRHPSSPYGVPARALAWKVLPLLACNPLRYALPEVPDNAELLRTWLSLFTQSADRIQQQRIASISHASVAHRFERNPQPGPVAWSRGAEVTLDLSGNHHSDGGALLFARILHHALADYCELGQSLRMQVRIDGETRAQWGPLYA